MITDKYLELLYRQQVTVERYKAHEANLFKDKITDLIDEMMLVDEMSERQLKALLAEVKKTQKSFYLDYFEELQNTFVEFGVIEATQEIKTLQSAYLATDYAAKVATADQVRRMMLSRPLQVGRQNGMKLLTDWIDSFTSSQIDAVNNSVMAGYHTGQTNQQIIQRLRGTRTNKYKDGIVSVLRRDADAIVRTSIQHVSNVSRMASWMQNQEVVVGYRIVATLDGKTSVICRSLDGRSYQIGKGPLPPFHVRCRSTTAPDIDEEFSYLKRGTTRSSQNGYVSGDLNYYDWLKTQPISFQDDVLGPTKAKLFRNGGISAEKFRRLQLDKNLNPLTLKELKKRAPQAFEAANIN